MNITVERVFEYMFMNEVIACCVAYPRGNQNQTCTQIKQIHLAFDECLGQLEFRATSW